MVEMGVYVDFRAELKWQLFRFGKDLDGLRREFNAAERSFPFCIFRSRLYFAFDRNHPLCAKDLRDLQRPLRFRRNDDLDGAASVAHIKKNKFAMIAPHLYPSGYRHTLPYRVWQFLVQRSFHTMFVS